MRIEEAILGRRSIRRFDGRPVPAEVVAALIALACTAPAPHHSRPWRFFDLASPQTRDRLTKAMSAAWHQDLENDGVDPETIPNLLEGSRRKLREPPTLLLACIVQEGARQWMDDRRRRAERDMYVQSLGAALQNLMLAAHARGLASYLMAAPLFCVKAVRQAFELPADHEPLFLIALGYPLPGVTLPPRPEIQVEDFLFDR